MTNRKPRVLAARHFPPDVEMAGGQLRRRPQSRDRLYDSPALMKHRPAATASCARRAMPLTAATIAALPASVRIIATFSVGYEHVVALPPNARSPSSNTPDVLTDATADITLLCLLGAARPAPREARPCSEPTIWVGWTPTQLTGVHVTGKRLGILGMGRIGQAVADRARAFRMRIHYSNRSRLPARPRKKSATFHANADDMLRTAISAIDPTRR